MNSSIWIYLGKLNNSKISGQAIQIIPVIVEKLVHKLNCEVVIC